MSKDNDTKDGKKEDAPASEETVKALEDAPVTPQPDVQNVGVTDTEVVKTKNKDILHPNDGRIDAPVDKNYGDADNRAAIFSDDQMNPSGQPLTDDGNKPFNSHETRDTQLDTRKDEAVMDPAPVDDIRHNPPGTDPREHPGVTVPPKVAARDAKKLKVQKPSA